MMKRLLNSLIIFFLVAGWLYSGNPHFFNLKADILEASQAGQMAIYRDTNGTQNIDNASYTGILFNTQQQQDTIFTQNANDIDVDLGEAGHYLFGYIVQASSPTYNNRISYRGRVTLAGSEQLLGHGQGYRRNTGNDTTYTYGYGIVNANSGDDVRVEAIRQGSYTTTHTMDANRSSFWLLKLDDAWDYLYLQAQDNQATTVSKQNINFTTEVENTDTDTDTYSHSTSVNPEQITLKETGHYLVVYSVGIDGSSSRTSITTNLSLNSTQVEQSFDYVYLRTSNSTTEGTATNMSIVNVTSADSILRLEWGATGAYSAYGTDTMSDRTAIAIVKIPDNADFLRVHESTGGQTINGTSVTTITHDTQDEADSGSFSYNTGTGVTTIQQTADYIFTVGMRTNRGTSGNTRLTRAGLWYVNSVQQSLGNTGLYVRGDQSTPDTFDGGWSGATLFSLSNTDTIDFRYVDEGDNGNSNDQIQADSEGITAVNLDTLFVSGFKQSAYRWFDNYNGTQVGDNPLAAQDTTATAPSQGTPFRLRLLLHVSSSTLDIGGENFKLQHAERSGTCDTSFTGESYSDVATASGAIRYYDNSTPSDGAALTSTSTDPTHGSDTVVNQTYEESNNFTSTSEIAIDEDGKWDFSLVDNSATANTTYCFRIVKSDGALLDQYSVIPEITTASTGGTLSVDIVDGVGSSVVSPSVAMGNATLGFSCQTSSGTFGTASEKIRVSNTTGSPAWTLTISTSTAAYWSGVSSDYDFNDASGVPTGCSDGGDGDSYIGQMSIDPSVSTITPEGGCSSTGISKGSSSAFSEGSTDTITLITADGTADTSCYWDVTGVDISQTIPVEQESDNYSIYLVLTVTAS